MARILALSVYILSSQHHTVFYTGVTSNLEQRVLQHKQGEGSVCTSKYNCYHLMYFEDYSEIRNALAREK